MGRLTFILGGARSGKSSYAQRLAEKHGGRVAFIATADAGDQEMAARILEHRRQRPPGWLTFEIPYGVAAALSAVRPLDGPQLQRIDGETGPLQADVILLDCMTLLVSNLLIQGGQAEIDEGAAAARVETETLDLLRCIREYRMDWIVVSNEVGLGLVPPYPLGRIYRDLLGRANQELAAAASEVFWMVAGIAVPIQDFRETRGTGK